MMIVFRSNISRDFFRRQRGFQAVVSAGRRANTWAYPVGSSNVIKKQAGEGVDTSQGLIKS